MFEDRLKELSKKNLFRKIKDRGTPQERIIKIQGKRVLNFSSNDYLGLCNHPLIKEAVINILKQYGTGSGASRLLSGGTELHHKLEQLLTELKGTESAIVYNSGYTANIGTFPSIVDNDTVIFSDELNHASIIDGCRLCKSSVIIYRHKDTEELDKLMGKHGREKSLIVTDSVFSMDGDIAPLGELREIALRHNALLYIDDAHGTGVIGGGRGGLHHFGLSPEHFIIQMGTLSKALGSFGAFVAARRDIITWLINTSRSLIYSTALPAHMVAASLEAIKVIKKEPFRIKRLWENRDTLVKGLQSHEIDTGLSETPIVPVLLKDNRSALVVSDYLYRYGIYAPAIRQPTAKTPRIRLTITAGHTKEDIYILLKALKEAHNCKLL